MEKSKGFKWRGMFTFLVVLALLVDAISGIILYITPPGRIIRWTGWTLWGLNKGDWQAIHTVFSFLLLLGILGHLYFNWRVLVHFFWSKMQSAMNLKMELAVAFLIILVVFIGTLWSVPPFKTVMTFGREMKWGWARENTPPPAFGSGFNRARGFSRDFRTGVGDHANTPIPGDPSGSSQLKGRDIVRLGRPVTLTGTLVQQGNEWALRAGDIVYEIHLGPAQYRDHQGFTLTEGEEAVVHGFLYGTDMAVTAMETGGKSISLRDESGRAVWSGTAYGRGGGYGRGQGLRRARWNRL